MFLQLVVIHHHSRRLLKMGILMFEICWANISEIKTTSDIKLVLNSSAITMMHSPINIQNSGNIKMHGTNVWLMRTNIVRCNNKCVPSKLITTFWWPSTWTLVSQQNVLFYQRVVSFRNLLSALLRVQTRIRVTTIKILPSCYRFKSTWNWNHCDMKR